MMNKTTYLGKLILSAILSVGVLFSCKEKEAEKVEIIRPVKVYEVGCNQGISSHKIFTGLVKESREVKIAFQIPGPLVKLNVDEGQFVRKGAVIAELDERDYKVQLQSAKANYDNAKSQAERYEALYEKKSTSKSVYDQTQASYKLAKAQLEAAENALKDTKIRAPFSGYVQSMFVENYEKIGAGQPIVSLLDLNNLEVSVALSENDFLQRDLFTEFSCKFENLKEETYQLSLIDIEKKPNGDNFYKMRLGFDSKENKIVPGMAASVMVQLETTDKEVCAVPVEAVFGDQGKSYVWKFNDKSQSVKRQEVRMLDFDSKGMIQIVEGLNNGDLIVTAGVHSLCEGQKVKKLNTKSVSNIGGQL
ncbi:efflux RND transporter periplasmic adaptor subunit [Puteibacter caeruleilacunae]|nr:efflux RND transporter periplasmic adaptor subunit [Puteibacter caeruleilacunae]